MEKSIAGSWSLILGASSGMGRATALALAAAGSHIIGIHLDRMERQPAVDELTAALRGYGVAAHMFNENAASESGRARLVPAIRELAGDTGLKVVLHSLAFGAMAPYLPPLPPVGGEDAPIATRPQMEMTLSVMAHSLVYWVQDLVRADLLRSGSRVFAMTSATTRRVSPTYGMVLAAKRALESHVRQLSVDLAGRGVSVNAIRAGVTLTDAFLRIPESADLSERALARHPHGRLTTPEDVADAVVLLSHASSSWLTGNIIAVDGGEDFTM
jgi:enoyl-[acyl-carrier protein] reductase III